MDLERGLLRGSIRQRIRWPRSSRRARVRTHLGSSSLTSRSAADSPGRQRTPVSSKSTKRRTRLSPSTKALEVGWPQRTMRSGSQTSRTRSSAASPSTPDTRPLHPGAAHDHRPSHRRHTRTVRSPSEPGMARSNRRYAVRWPWNGQLDQQYFHTVAIISSRNDHPNQKNSSSPSGLPPSGGVQALTRQRRSSAPTVSMILTVGSAWRASSSGPRVCCSTFR